MEGAKQAAFRLWRPSGFGLCGRYEWIGEAPARGWLTVGSVKYGWVGILIRGLGRSDSNTGVTGLQTSDVRYHKTKLIVALNTAKFKG
jgi:hypothetical protein